MNKQKVTFMWSKKENDWVARYPDLENGESMGNALFLMIHRLEEFISDKSPVSFRDYLSNKGFDPDSFRIEVDKLKLIK